jgi:nucleoid DNA-binding protein/septal ring-binding cell division protein DamX
MTIGKCIRQLLEERKKVILPGFGNLEVREPEGVPFSGRRIEPPGLTVRFDSSFSKDDGVLAVALTNAGIAESAEATQKVLELVDAIRFALDRGVNYELADAGTFNRDEEGRVLFKPEPGWVLEPEQYGLGSVDLLELEELPESAEPGPEEGGPAPSGREEEVSSGPAYSGPVPELEAVESSPVQSAEREVLSPPVGYQAPVPPTLPEREGRSRVPSGRRFSGWRIIWIITGLLIVVLVTLILVPADQLGIFRERKAKPPATVDQPVARPDASRPAETVTPEETGESAAPQSATRPAIGEDTEQTELQEPSMKYFLIAGSFRNLRNASELQDQLKAKGYETEVMITENRMYRVSVASYVSKQEAEKALAGMKSVPGLESCWLLSNE